MCRKWSSSCLLLVIVFLMDISKAPDKVHIGGIFDRRSIQALTAFRHEVHIFNRAQAKRFRVLNDTSILDVTDSFAVSNALCHHLSSGNLAIFGVSNASSLATIQSYTDTFRVPYVTISTAQNFSHNSSYQLYMRPMYINAVVDVIMHYEWKKVAFYYDSDEGLVRLQQLFQATNRYSSVLTIDTKRITDDHNGYLMLKELHLMDPDIHQRVLLDVRTDKAEKIILKVMNDTEINNSKFHFLLGDLGMLEINLTNFKIGGLDITGFQLVDPLNQTAKLFISTWSNLDPKFWPGAGTEHLNYEAALAADSVRLFTRAFGSLLHKNPGFLRRSRLAGIGKSLKCTDDSEVRTGYGEEILQEMKRVRFDGITGHVEFDEYGQRKDFTLDIYNVAMARRAAKVGFWSQREGRVHMQPPRLVPNPEETNENRTRIVVTIIKEPYVMWKGAPKNGEPLVAVEHLEGFCIDLTKAVAEKVGFDYAIRFVKDGSYGSVLSNGSWDGIVGELIAHEAHMAIAPFTITADRSRVIDFTKPFMSLGISIMIKRPQPAGKHFFSFMEPLSYEIWMCIVFAYIGVSVVLFLVSRFSPNEWHLSETEHSIANDFSISNSLWFSLGAFMQQGCDISPRSMSGRIVGSVWWFFTLIIISSYTANLAAFLTVERMLTPIDSAEDLARQTDIQYGTIISGSTRAFFQNSEFQTYKRMWAYMTSAQPNVFVQKHEDGIARVRDSGGKYAYLTESTTIEYVSSRKPCDTLKVGNNLNSDGFGIGTPLGSDLKNKLNFAVLELRENGDLAKWEKHWFDQGDCEKYNSNKDGVQSALDLANVAGIFYILTGGLITAVLSAVVEFVYKSKIDSTQHGQMSFGSALRSKARLSFRGHVDKEHRVNGTRRRSHNSVTYTYKGPSSVVGGSHGFDDVNTHTEV
uniref:Glutamate receptor subunit protein GluR3 n=1 Tax=Aplysia californica TaxID=6500 RepID=Q7Z1H7_APLCA|nr:glutamate receptor subunit protein GluR3 precursor [Aplysia californica]AAP41205.1 glutamate receptor subunit protein GluR3 [Aplysia californica]